MVQARAVIVATGGAAGIYRPNNQGSAHHKMWYPPFNTGAGYAMGIRGGAEMTSFEMRFIALRTKDVIAPTGTLALGFGAIQVNSRGERFMAEKYAHWVGVTDDSLAGLWADPGRLRRGGVRIPGYNPSQ